MLFDRGLAGRSRAAPANAVTVEALGLTGGAGTALESGETAAMKLSAVSRCVEILSDSMGKLPNFLMDTRTRRRIEGHDILRLLNVRPNEDMTPSVRRKLLEANRLTCGNAYDWIVRDPATGRPRELIPVPARLVEPWRDLTGRLWYTVYHPYTGAPMKLDREDVLHYKAYTRDGIRGVSVLSRAAEVIGAGRAAQEYELAYYRNGGHPAGILTTQADLGGYVTVKDADGTERVISKKDRLREEWEKIHAGPSKGHRIAVLDLSAEYKPLSISNREAQFVEGKEISVKDIARFFGIPLYKLQEGKQAYSSNEQNAIEYVVSTLHPIVSQYEEEQTWKLLTDTELADGLELRINMMAELRGDFATRGAWHKGMRETGVFSVNDIRALEDLPDVEGGDERYASLNYVPLRSWAELSRQRAEKGGSSNARNA